MASANTFACSACVSIPHALREENAYYDPIKKALLFGYFPARPEAAADGMPGGMTFSCLSHDIIAHETTHAILDGMQRHFLSPGNRDVLAFHEAFADLVALFQHFTYPEILRHQIARARGDLGTENMLGQLAIQFGKATGATLGVARRVRDSGGRQMETAGARAAGLRRRGRAARARRAPGGGDVRRVPRDLPQPHPRPAAHCDRRHRASCRSATSIPTWSSAWRRKRQRRLGTSS